MMRCQATREQNRRWVSRTAHATYVDGADYTAPALLFTARTRLYTWASALSDQRYTGESSR